MRILLIGATGLVGSKLTARLLGDPAQEVHTVVRRGSPLKGPGLREHVAPASEWPQIVRELRAEVAVSALGTTIKAAGSEAAFRSVDHDMVLSFAEAARAAGARHMLTVSSVGANSGSRNFYLRLKGEVEEALERLGFERLDIFRPGLLRGERGGDRRVGERIAIRLSPLTNAVMRGPFDRFAAIDADAVAAAMAEAIGETSPGLFKHENRAIHRLARR